MRRIIWYVLQYFDKLGFSFKLGENASRHSKILDAVSTVELCLHLNMFELSKQYRSLVRVRDDAAGQLFTINHDTRQLRARPAYHSSTSDRSV